MQFPHARILVFAKAPLPGACKTRLIPSLGPEGAAKFAEDLLVGTLERIANADLAQVELWCAPDTVHSAFQALAERHKLQLQTQRGSELGARMQAAMTAALSTAEPVLLIGTDCPDLDAAYLQQALAALTDSPAVLGPANDGGYVLLGLKRAAVPALPALFAPMPWGTGQVAANTRERMRAAGLDWTELPSLADIDRPEDLAAIDLGWRC